MLLANFAVSFPFAIAAGFLQARGGRPFSLESMKLAVLMEQLPTLMIFSLVASVAATCTVAVAAFWLAGDSLRDRVLARSRLGSPALTVVALFLCSIGYGAVTTWLTVELGGFADSNLDAFERLCFATGPLGVAVLVVAGGLGPGFGEELAFRGFIQPRFTARWGPLVGIGATALLFGFLHMDVWQGAFATGIGVLYGWAAWRSGTVWLGMLAHALNNSASFALTRLAGRTDPAVVPPPAELVPWVAALVVGVALLIWQSRRAARE